MPRPRRIEYPGAWHHVMNRGAAKAAIFHDHRDRLVFLEIVGKETVAVGIEVHGVCLMDNHFHLLIRTPKPRLAQAMKMIGGRYTQWYNARRDRDGSLFKGRYQAIAVEADAHLLQVSRYIHLNPVEAGIVDKPEDYSWSSYCSYIGTTHKPDWLHTRFIKEMLSHEAAHQSYRDFVDAGNDKAIIGFYQRQRPGNLLGSRKFRKQTKIGV